MKWTTYLNHKATTTTQYIKGNVSSLITIKEIKSVIKVFPREKYLGSDNFTREFYQLLKEKQNFFQKIEF